MNLNDNPTLEQFRALLLSHNSKAGNHVLWVRKDGEVLLACLPKSDRWTKPMPTYEHPDMLFRYSTFPVGSVLIGVFTPEYWYDDDESWLKEELVKHMIAQWARLKGSGGVTHFDLDEDVAPYGMPLTEEEKPLPGA